MKVSRSTQIPSSNPTNTHSETSRNSTDATTSLFHTNTTELPVKKENSSTTINQSPNTKIYASGLLKTPIPNGNAQEISIDGMKLGIKHVSRKQKKFTIFSRKPYKYRGKKVADGKNGVVVCKHDNTDTAYKKYESFKKPDWLPNDMTNEQYTIMFNEEAKKLYVKCQNSGVNIFVNFISRIKNNVVKYIVPTTPGLKETNLDNNKNPVFIEQTMRGHKAGGIFLDNKPDNWLSETRIDTDHDIQLLVFFRLWQEKIDKGENFTFDEVRKAISIGTLGEFCTLHPDNLKILLCDNDIPQLDKTLKYLRLQGLFGACIIMAGDVLNDKIGDYGKNLAENPMFWQANSLGEIKIILQAHLPNITLPNAPNFRDELINFMLAFKDSSNFYNSTYKDNVDYKELYEQAQANIEIISKFMDKYDNYIKDWGITASSIPENSNASINSSISENVTPNTSSNTSENLNTSINTNSSISENVTPNTSSNTSENLNTSINSSISEKSNAGKSNKHRKTKPQKTRTSLKSIFTSFFKFLTRFFSRNKTAPA
ncbi:MAG: hypothetical protein QG673_55 [Pseudomonadota bacterium]|nr:hypothetical protein [Pseudomonadota bacterium]